MLYQQLKRSFLIYLMCSVLEVLGSNNILYGGILGENVDDVNDTDSDIAEVVLIATNYATKYESLIVSSPDQTHVTSEPVILGLHKVKLHYTTDEATHYVKVERHLVNGREKIQTRRAIIGINYRINLTWKNSSNFHEFLITKDRVHRLFISQHTFYRSGSRICTKYTSTFESKNVRDRATEHLTVSDQSSSESDGHVITPSQSIASILRKNPLSLCGECHGSESYSTSHWKVPQNETQEEFKILSYNIWNFNSVENHPKYYVKRIQQLGKLVASSRSDIIGFQEVRFDQSNGAHLGPAQVQHLANHLPAYQFVYQPAVSYFSENLLRVEEGLAIFSKYPIIDHDYILLSRNISDEEDSVHQRICLRAEIDIPYIGQVHVFVTHLSLSAAARLRSVREIWNYMNTMSGPAILLGDFNDEPHGKPIQFLSGKIDINGIWTQNLKDAWRIFHKEPRADAPGVYKGDENRDYGLTFNRLDRHLRKRIDYIFLRLPEYLELQEVSLLEDVQWKHKATSDHMAVEAVIKRIDRGG
ncbi:uncharacterized protein LOC117118849 [Anneissia japonica]|uniref:uncharacterized protein LOC117118849 n=1 Tax=Anneissia japonica TaxID=1529436 RepID=UPI001425854F|nr:uncharacterized protein LOC117118849 [Anneissia japonica]